MQIKFYRKKTSPNETNFYLDIIILLGFLLIMEPDLTGIAIHEWFSLALGGAMALHIILHWKWITAIVKVLFKKFFHQTRLKFVLSVILLISFAIVFWSGLMESEVVLRFFGLHASSNTLWEWLHSYSSNLMWFAVGLHLLLDWRWIIHAFQRYITAPLLQSRRGKDRA